MTFSNIRILTGGEPERWQMGPVDGISVLLQPVAQALLQMRDEVNTLLQDADERIWEKPAGLASPAFHLRHLRGVLDRLFTYADGRMLTEEQFAELRAEELVADTTPGALLEALNRQVFLALEQLSATGDQQLTEERLVGRKKIPSTVIGLYFHAAEHSMRHTGQLIVTWKTITG